MKKKILILIISLLTLITLQSQKTYSQWYRQTLPVNKPIAGIKFVDTLRGWAITYNFTETNQDTSYILHTTNSGNNWFIQLMKIPFDFDALFMVDSLVGYVSCDSISGNPPFTTASPRLFKTLNGGVNWFNIPLVPNMGISQMFFLNHDTGWECQLGTGPDVRLTTDGGITWEVRTSGINSSNSYPLFFLNYNTGFCGAGLDLYKTTNAGQNWNLLNTFSDNIHSVYFININTGWCGLSLNKISFTSDGGNSWINQPLPPNSSSNTYDISFFNNILGYAGTSFNKIFKTTNGGLNWGYQIDTGGSVHTAFSDSLHGWTGNVGIYSTSDGGGQIIYVGIIRTSNDLPRNYKLYQNYPNPFNSTTVIKFLLKEKSRVKFRICDITGKEINLWSSSKLLDAGTHEISFNAGDLSSSVYFYEIVINDEKGNEKYRKSMKMVLTK